MGWLAAGIASHVESSCQTWRGWSSGAGGGGLWSGLVAHAGCCLQTSQIETHTHGPQSSRVTAIGRRAGAGLRVGDAQPLPSLAIAHPPTRTHARLHARSNTPPPGPQSSRVAAKGDELGQALGVGDAKHVDGFVPGGPRHDVLQQPVQVGAVLAQGAPCRPARV